jgi:CheY-like chemotaxis protein
MASKKTLLVVDDDEVIREGLALVLRDAGNAVVALGNGREALDYLHHNAAPDLILLDMMMPEYDGWAFLRARYAEPALAAVPVVVLTAIGVACPEWANSLGGDGFLHKPLDMERVVAEVKGQLEAKPVAVGGRGDQVRGWCSQ